MCDYNPGVVEFEDVYKAVIHAVFFNIILSQWYLETAENLEILLFSEFVAGFRTISSLV
jgi:hypothetical protein